MMTEQVQTTVKRHKPALVIGIAIGLVALVGYIGYEMTMTPSMPNAASAKPAEMIAYVSNARGLSRLSEIEQQRFLDQWKEHAQKEPARSELRDYLKKMGEDEGRAFIEAMTTQAKRAFMEDAKRFARLSSSDEKSKYIRQKVGEYTQQTVFFKDIAAGLKPSGGGRSEDVQQWVLEHTTAEERAIGEPYVNALKRVRDQVRKEERAASTAPRS